MITFVQMRGVENWMVSDDAYNSMDDLNDNQLVCSQWFRHHANHADTMKNTNHAENTKY